MYAPITNTEVFSEPNTLNQTEKQIKKKEPDKNIHYKESVGIIILLDRFSQRNKDQDAMQEDMEIAIQEESTLLVSGAILRNYIKRGQKIQKRYQIYELKNSDLYLLLSVTGSLSMEAFNLNETDYIRLNA